MENTKKDLDFSEEIWRNLDKAYLEHHFGCATCISAGHRHGGLRCRIGSELWRAYINFPRPQPEKWPR